MNPFKEPATATPPPPPEPSPKKSLFSRAATKLIDETNKAANPRQPSDIARTHGRGRKKKTRRGRKNLKK
jgi:hypothetical protein